MTSKLIWTATAHALLFEQLVVKFGPYHKWEGRDDPGRNLESDYEQFCEVFAELMGTSTEAVKLQIAFALPWDTGVERSYARNGHAGTAVRAMVHAYDASFIRASDFPSLIATF